MREWITFFYIVGFLVTAAGIVVAFFVARRELGRLDAVQRVHDGHADDDPVELFDVVLAGHEDAVAELKSKSKAERDELNEKLRAAGMSTEGTLMKDMRLPMDYWAKRSALKDAVASFKTGGVIALAGLLVTTAASIASLQVPPE